MGQTIGYLLANNRRQPALSAQTAHSLQAEGGTQRTLSLWQRAQVQALLRQMDTIGSYRFDPVDLEVGEWGLREWVREARRADQG